VYTLEDYRDGGIMTVEQYDRIIEAVETRKNILVSGGTGSGKTTLLNAVSDTIARRSGLDQRIVIIEDTREIVCNAPNTVSMLTDPDTGIDMTRLLKLTLRYRPDRIFVGEVRDGAALALLKAWGTGHPGGLATLHANNPLAALTRLDQLCQEAGVPSQMPLIRETVDVVIQIARDPVAKAGRRISDILFIDED
jgi:type IV secretion system protein VirB11